MATEDNQDRPYGPIPPRNSGPSPVEQEQSAVAGRQRLSARQIGGVAAACAVGAGIVLLVTQLTAHHAAKQEQQASLAGGTTGRPFVNNVTTASTSKQPPASLPLPAQHTASVNPFLINHQESPAEKALNAPLMAFNQAGAEPASAPAPNTVGQGGASAQPAAKPSAFANALNADQFSAADATMIAHPDMTIAAGTLIPCTLQTAIDSTLPGFVKCVLPQPVTSMTGTVTLLDKGTQVLGEIRAGLVQGQDRLFILWDRAVTPQNVAIQLASPAADSLGRAGVSGAVNNHFMQRFGAAIMMTIIGGSLQVAANAAQNGNGNSYFQYLNSNTDQIANTTLQNEINIPPTLTKNQGDNVTIFVARDLNFSKVYQLSAVGP
jgi:type IV secretion system protein VirB10